MKRNRLLLGSLLAFAFALAATGCATTPPELQIARAEVQQAAGGELARADSTDVYEARRVVQEADTCVEQLCDADVIRDLAYIAHRRIERARVVARISSRIDADETAARAARATLPEAREAAR
jgi:hypothetical protein